MVKVFVLYSLDFYTIFFDSRIVSYILLFIHLLLNLPITSIPTEWQWILLTYVHFPQLDIIQCLKITSIMSTTKLSFRWLITLVLLF